MLTKKSHFLRARRKQSRRERKFQSQLSRMNPNYLEQTRTPEFQANGQVNFDRSAERSSVDPQILWLLTFLLIMSGIRLTCAERESKPSQSQNNFASLANTTAIQLEVNHTWVSRVGSDPVWVLERTSSAIYQNTLFEETQRKKAIPNIDSIIAKRDAKAFKDYLKKIKHLKVTDSLIELASDSDANEMMLYLLNTGKEGGWQFLSDVPKLFIFHLFKEAKKSNNDYLLYVMLQSNLLENIKPIVATYNNIIKYIQNNNIEKLKAFFQLKSGKGGLKFDTSELTRDFFSDKRTRDEFLMLSKKSDNHMRQTVESLCEQFSHLDQSQRRNHDAKEKNNLS